MDDERAWLCAWRSCAPADIGLALEAKMRDWDWQNIANNSGTSAGIGVLASINPWAGVVALGLCVVASKLAAWMIAYGKMQLDLADAEGKRAKSSVAILHASPRARQLPERSPSKRASVEANETDSR